MAVAQNGLAPIMYRCRHWGQGCRQPARTNTGLAEAAALGLKLIGKDERLYRGDPTESGLRQPRGSSQRPTHVADGRSATPTGPNALFAMVRLVRPLPR